ncbi:MAG: type II toxin-antitoxin system RelE/ParE family toxin [Anaerolineae bacterium]|nr:type II toxin-antitoxin system RelE/ParE family toxin [Anaerolineae bacterium]
MTYRLRITETAKQELRRLPGYVRQRARHIVKALADDPRPSEAKELRDMPGRYRIRLVKWRVIYRVDDENQVVLVLRVRRKIGPETYKGIE